MDQLRSHPVKVLLIHATTPFELECIFEGEWEDFCQKTADIAHILVKGRVSNEEGSNSVDKMPGHVEQFAVART